MRLYGSYSKWASSLTVPIKVSDVLPTMYLKGSQDPLLFWSEEAKDKGHVVHTRDCVSAIPTLAAAMKQGERSSGEGGLQLSRL